MKGRSSVPCALAMGIALLPGCTLDFDRYDPKVQDQDQDAAGAVGDDSMGDGYTDQTTQVPAPDANDGPGSDASADATSSCAMPGNCLPEATSCGSTCGRSYQTCINNCGDPGCMQKCTNTEQSCLGNCVSVCIACAKDAGCSTSNSCVTSAHP